MPALFGDHVKHGEIREKDGSQPYLFIENIEAILPCVQMGIRIHRGKRASAHFDRGLSAGPE
jgi:hypothetical protein